MKGLYNYAWLILLCFWGLSLKGQSVFSGQPISFTKDFQDKYGNNVLKTAQVPAFNQEQVWKEDEEFAGQPRFAAPLPLDLGLENAGQWTVFENGDRIWRLKLQSPEALGLILLYDRFYLPPGAMLFLYNEDRDRLAAPLNNRHNRPNGKYVSDIFYGESAILEYFEPKNVRGQGKIHLFRLDHIYQKDGLANFEKTLQSPTDIGFRSSLPCNENIGCPQGDTLLTHRKAICRIMMVLEEGTGFCTGNLMNNTNEDGAPYMLTAFHCQDGYTPMYDFWRFDFKYEGPDCSDPAVEPVPVSVQGCLRRAGRQENDFLLLEVTQDIPAEADAVFLGWNRADESPLSGRIIHHPNADIKKLAYDNDLAKIHPRSIVWNNEVTTPAAHHFEVIYDQGTFELGSSGAALLNQDGLVVGQLHGGFAVCSETTGYFGRLTLAWEGGGTPETRLKDWLDPAGTGQMSLGGSSGPDIPEGTLAGVVRTEDSQGIANAKVYLIREEIQDSTTTDISGNFSFEKVPMQDGYHLSINKSDRAIIGVSSLDLIRIQKHLLSSKLLDSPYKMLAADVDQSGSISLIDLVRIRKVLLAQRTSFGDTPIWQFLPAAFEFTDPNDPFADPMPVMFPLIQGFTEDLLNLNFIGFKTGDANASANPGN